MYLLEDNTYREVMQCRHGSMFCLDIHQMGYEIVAPSTSLNLNPTWTSNHTHHNVSDEIVYLFPNFNGVTVEVCEWVCDFILQFTGHVIVVVVTLFSNIIHEQNTSNTHLTNKAYPGYCKHVLFWRPPEKSLSLSMLKLNLNHVSKRGPNYI